jgi:hypothetical protein
VLILVIALVVLLYFSNIFSYSMGIKHGRIVKDGGRPQVNPVEIAKEKKAIKLDKAKQDVFAEGLSNIMAYGEGVKEE